MTKYRCVVFQSTGNYVPYSGVSYQAASDAFEDYRACGALIVIEQNAGDGYGWSNIVTYQPGRV